MNRHERRSLGKIKMAQQIENLPLKIHYGHDGNNVVMQFSQPVRNNHMTEKQTEDMIHGLQETLKVLREYKSKIIPVMTQ